MTAAEFDPEAYRNWTPETQRKAMELAHAAQTRPWKPFYCSRVDCDGRPHVAGPFGNICPDDKYGHWWTKVPGGWVCDPEFGCGATGTQQDDWNFAHARADQRPPPWKERWRTWAITSGRGGGKTTTGSRLVHRVAEREPNIILIGATGPDLRETMVEGISGILATSPPDKRPLWEPSKKKLTWPNGAVARGFSAEEPDRLRGPQSGFAWLDEAAHYALVQEVWDNLLFGLRLGRPSHVLMTSTPTPTKWMKALLKEERTRSTRVATYANLYNLDPAYRATILERYEGTRLGRQELHGELLEDVEGSLWQAEMIQTLGTAPEEFERIVVAVDPAGTATKRSDETGIIVIGWADKHAYVLQDLTGTYSPAGWGDKVWAAYEKWGADAVVAEKNYGGEMVKHVLETSTKGNARIKMVTSRRGKALRAEPIVAQYEKENVTHCGNLVRLEEEMLSWVPGEGASPNRVDALVHGLTELFRGSSPSSMASPSDILRHLRRNGPFDQRDHS